jgi:carbonic anhydrase
MANLRLLSGGGIILAVGAAGVAGERSRHWSYDGISGPSHWATLDAKYIACAARSQSPIEIRARDVRTTALPALAFHYHPVPLRIVDNGHTVQVNYDAGSWLEAGDTRYELVQFHFHRPSEEVIDGQRFAMVAHLVHRDAQGHIGVVAVPLSLGADDFSLKILWENLPKVKGAEVTRTDVKIDAESLLPASLGYYAYAGSLTMPPCSEGVRWMVLKTPSLISQREVEIFAARYPNNARPLQPRNGREILSSD